MARAVTPRRKTINTVVAWIVGLLIFFPILWTILTSFKTEATAIADPPVFLFFDWTLENYSIVQERSDYMRFLWNSVIIAGGSTLLGILIAVPAAGAIVVGGVLWRRATKEGAAASMVGGVTATFAWEAYGSPAVEPVLAGFLVSAALFFVVSLVTPPPPESAVAPYFDA